MTAISSLSSYGYGTSPLEALKKAREEDASSRAQANQAQGTSGGDTASISDTAKELSRIMAKAKGENSGDSSESQDPIERIKKKIDELEKKIAAVQQSRLPDGAKQGMVKGLETELAALQQELARMMSEAKSQTGSSAAKG
ncbi:hypothetical protein NNJEOMEG_00262 [Fundidesulfovibrio magnetotacticus]|uniref:FlxA-like protein n=1 Tax=Fundidesulfovibrio magnetotacticus TaxID=2730080 RepID=A0A6V8LS50_9BACT|nr:hypothetical protein [Fundidesulfovibrio magnetotacticus]GFK92437.1 hypothetical protein NNJEOMEG_00262 [Fundidesulfovibrio magnetotacticus]